MDEFRIGISAYPTADPSLLADAGIGWLRQGFRFPFLDRLGGEVTEEYRQAKANAEAWAARGFQVMGVTPLIGLARYEPDEQGQLRRRWRDWYPSWMGRFSRYYS